jgi:hypothetical protein
MKIYISKDRADILMGFIRKNDLPFHIEQSQWEFVDDISDADVIPIVTAPFEVIAYPTELKVSLEQQVQYLNKVAKGKCILVMVHTHVSETYGPNVTDMHVESFKEVSDHVYQVTPNHKSIHAKHIFHDFYFNFCKAYFCDYSRYDLKAERLWSQNSNNKSYDLLPIKEFNPTKKFLVPNNIRFHSNEYKEHARMELRKITSDEECHFSDFQRGITLDPEESGLDLCYTEDGAGLIPIANRYYEDTVVSVFVETIGGSNPVYPDQVGAMTEKTFIPFLKGHFILPFSAPGFVQFLKSHYGFKFPDWIDYSYDSVYNDDDRLTAYLNSVKKLKSLPLTKLVELANLDIELRHYNRQLVYDIPYDSLHDKVKARIYK